jgi:hypothetical protein
LHANAAAGGNENMRLIRQHHEINKTAWLKFHTLGGALTFFTRETTGEVLEYLSNYNMIQSIEVSM